MARPTQPILPTQPRVLSVARSPEHRWITDGGTMNPAPHRTVKEMRDTAAGCRDRATADLLEAVTMNTANGRRVLEKSAASWSLRAELMDRIESGIEARRDESGSGDLELTSEEIAEDAAHVRL